MHACYIDSITTVNIYMYVYIYISTQYGQVDSILHNIIEWNSHEEHFRSPDNTIL